MIRPAYFPLLSVLGMHIMNTSDNNVMLMALLFLIPAYVIFIAVKHKQVPERAYAPIIFLTSISLVLLLGLRSNHIIGIDAHVEYYLFQQTFHNGQWQILLNSTLDSCLSISILPTIYQSFLNINSEYLFKILYPLLFSISALVVYLISKKYIGSLYAFLASLFFMSQSIFLNTALSPRTNIAILFFALSIMVLFHAGLTDFNKRLLFIVFAASCIVSHYSSTYIFFLMLLLTWMGMQIIPKIIASRRKLALPANLPAADPPKAASQLWENQATTVENTRGRLKGYITIGLTALFFVILFFWYSQVTGAAFNSGVSFISTTLKKLPEFFILESRGGGVASAFGAELGAKGIPQHITFVFSWLTIAFIAIGVLTTLARYRHRVAFSNEMKQEPPEFLAQKLDAEFFILSLACSAILAASVALPFIYRGYGMGRAWCQMMTVLSPFFVIGGIMIARFIRVRWAYLMVLVVLIPYFMCQTGTMYQIFGVPQAITLNSEGKQYNLYYAHDQETYACQWLGKQIKPKGKAYADFSGHDRLVSQGSIPISSTSNAVAFFEQDRELNGYIYLRYYNVVDGKLIGPSSTEEHELREYWTQIMRENKIYANGGSEVWR